MQTDPMTRFDLRVREVPIKLASNLQVLVSQSRGVPLDDEEISVVDKYNEAIKINVIAKEHSGKQTNNDFIQPIDVKKGVTGSTFEEDGVMYVQNCLYGGCYYTPYDIYGNIDETTTILAHPTDTWSLCDNAPSFKDNPLVKTDDEFDDW